MKSKKAKEFIFDKNFEDTTMKFSSVQIFARTAVEHAEQEMVEKAIEAFKTVLDGFNLHRTEQMTATNDFTRELFR